jgi:hypothetical protein
MQKPVKRADLVKLLTDELESCEAFLKTTAHDKSSEFDDTHTESVIAATPEQLGLMVNTEGLTLELVKARLKGEDIDTPQWHIKSLYDIEFDYDDYKALGDNDGRLRMLDLVLSHLGEEALAKRAVAAMYNTD